MITLKKNATKAEQLFVWMQDDYSQSQEEINTLKSDIDAVLEFLDDEDLLNLKGKELYKDFYDEYIKEKQEAEK